MEPREEEDRSPERSLWADPDHKVKTGDESLGPQVSSLRPSSARYSFARARNRAAWRSSQENTPGPGTYDINNYTAAQSCASKVCAATIGRPDSAKSARRMEAPKEENYHQEGLTYPTEAWECTTAATPRKYMVFGTESRDAQVFDMDLLKECAHTRYGIVGPGLVYNPDDRRVRPSSARHSFPRSRNSQVQSLSRDGVAPCAYQHDQDSIATKQANSKRRTAQAFSFGRASRFPATKRAEGARTAECVNGSSNFGCCEAGLKQRRAPTATFGYASREEGPRLRPHDAERPASARLGRLRVPHPELAPRQEILKFCPIGRR